MLLWESQERALHEQLQLEAEVVADQVHYRLESWIEARMAVMGVLSDHWDEHFSGNLHDYRLEVQAVLKNLSGFQALNWVCCARSRN